MQAIFAFTREHAASDVSTAEVEAQEPRSASVASAATPRELVDAYVADVQLRQQDQQQRGSSSGDLPSAGLDAGADPASQRFADLLGEGKSGALQPELRLLHAFMAGKRMILWDVVLGCREMGLIRRA